MLFRSGLSAADVSTALKANNVQAAPGQLKGADTAINITASTDVNGVEGFRQMVIKRQGSAVVTLGDVATVELGLSVVFDISALVAGIRGGRLVAVHSGRCDVTATLAIQDTEVISRRVHLQLPGIIPLGQGIGLLPDHGREADPGDETPQASVA